VLNIEKHLTGALRWLFLLVGGAILTLPGLIAVGGSVAAYWRPHLSQRTVATVQEAPTPLAPSAGNVWSADFQASVERWAGAAIGFRNQFIRLHSRVNWELFAVPPKAVELVVVGRSQQLYEAHYVDEYCTGRTQRAFDLPPGERIEWLTTTIAAIRDEFVRRNKPFAVLISPTKPAVYPEDLPPQRCATGEASGRLYHRVLPLLQQRGIPVIDGATATRALKAQGETPVFNRYGTHWNLLGAYPAARDLLITLARLAGLPPPTLEITSVRLSRDPIAGSNDLALMMGLETRLIDPQTPHPQFAVRNGGPMKGWQVAFVGGSFVNQPFHIYQNTGVFTRMVHYWATIGVLIEYSERGVERSVVRNQFDWRRALNSDAVVLELNEVLAEPQMDRAIAAMFEALRDKR
jgi:hypothetical protein